MTGVQTWSTTAANNVNANTGVNWDEGMSPGAVNNSARQVLADVRTMANDAAWFEYGSGTGPQVAHVYASGTSTTVAGVDKTSVYHAGRRVRAVGTSTGTIFGFVSSSSFSTNTTVNYTWDSGSLSNETLTISISQTPVTGKPIPGWNPTAGKTLTVTNNITLAATDGSSPFTLPTRQNLTSGSGATYTTPVGVRQLRIRMVGGGGAGSRINGSAAGPVNGGFTSFDNGGTNYKANGGTGATSAAGGGVAGAGGTGGTGGTSPNTTSFPGGAGGPGAALRPGSGGSSILGGGAPESTAGVANSGGGGGGEQGSDAGAGGGAGEGKEIIINSPAASYTYTIGAGATALGSAGSGGSGRIVVDEIY